ncbi:alpha/beta hydrolase [Patescibacteria group bacterium]|nr:alpha/beta hydrolase [Patescibacteria group bacterium]
MHKIFGENFGTPSPFSPENFTNESHNSKITCYSEYITGRKKIIFVPGIVPVVKRTYASQIAHLKSLGRYNVCGADYAECGFSITEFEDTLIRSIEQDEEVSLVATSFGTRVVTDILANNPPLASRISELVLFGPFCEIDRSKGTLALIKSFRSKIPVSSLGLLEEPVVRLARSKFNYDPNFYKDDDDKAKMIQETAILGLTARMSYFSRPFDFDRKIDTPTTIVWWEKEPSSQKQKNSFTSMFTNVQTEHVKGKHGHLQTEAQDICQVLDKCIF